MNEQKKKLVLVVDDEASMRKNIIDILSREGCNIIEAADGLEAIDQVKKQSPDLILLDINLPQLDGLSALAEIRKIKPDSPVIIFTAYGTSDRAIEAMKEGAFDYIEKPFELDEFVLNVKRACNYADLIQELKELRTQVSNNILHTEEIRLIGRSVKMQEIFKLIGRAAPSDATILIQGESGTGKELIADAIQKYSLLKEKPYIKINCGALSESLLESEIFGHEKGAFTGAIGQKLGCFELANNGTIFLDEINNMPPSLQVRLLRLLQNQSFFRVGGEVPVTVNVRVIAATNTDIEKEVAAGKFRKDLFYRLNIIRLNIPPLRDRVEDIPFLAEHFLRKYSPARDLVLSAKALATLQSYDWPGNVRELENLIHSTVVMARENVISELNLPEKTQTKQVYLKEYLEQSLEYGLKNTIDSIEKECILNALKKSDWNKTEAAVLLKIHRRLLYSKMKEYGITVG